ncbi:MAG: hypothetical protein R6V04_14135 [bacterium]
MDTKLDNIIEKIKKEGVEDAQKQADKKIKEAHKDADKIIKEAKNKADKIVSNAKKEIKKMEATSEVSLKQASRDTMLQVKNSIIGLFDNAFKRQVSSALTPDFIKKLIIKIVEEWEKGDIEEVKLNKKDKKKVEELLLSSLKKDMKEGITIQVDKEISQGFRIGLKDEDVYYDFTEESITDLVMKYLNPRLREILDKKDG